MKPNGILKWFVGDAVAIDEVGNAFILDGDAHETISAHCGAQFAAKRPCIFCRLVCGFIQGVLGKIFPRLKTHCQNAYVAEQGVIAASKNLPGGS